MADPERAKGLSADVPLHEANFAMGDLVGVFRQDAELGPDLKHQYHLAVRTGDFSRLTPGARDLVIAFSRYRKSIANPDIDHSEAEKENTLHGLSFLQGLLMHNQPELLDRVRREFNNAQVRGVFDPNLLSPEIREVSSAFGRLLTSHREQETNS